MAVEALVRPDQAPVRAGHDATGDPEAPDFTWHRDAFRLDDA